VHGALGDRPAGGTRATGLRVAALALAAVGLAVAVQGWSDARGRRILLQEARRFDLAEPGTALVHTLRFAPDLDDARLALARTALASELKELRQAGHASPERLRWAEKLSERAYAGRASSFEAASTLALARLLGLQQARDPRLYTERALWEEPLQAAIRLAPGESEPRAVLLRARLALWFSLSRVERAETTELARRAFTDPTVFDSLWPVWFAVHDPWTPDAVEALPDSGRAFHTATYVLGGRDGFAVNAALRRRAHDRAAAALAAAAAAARGAGSLDALAFAPPSRRFAGDANQVLERLPPGTILDDGRVLVAWWRWLVDEADAGRVGLTPVAEDRLALATRAPDCERALVLAARGHADDLGRAVALEPRATTMASCWAPYLRRKANWLSASAAGDRGRAAQAARELAGRVDPVGDHAARDGWRLAPDRASWQGRVGGHARTVRVRLAAGRDEDPRWIEILWNGWWFGAMELPADGTIVATLPPVVGATAVNERGPHADGGGDATFTVVALDGRRPNPLSIAFDN
jgi:hypothetical protein